MPPGLARVYAVNPVAMILLMFHRALYEGAWLSLGQVAVATLTTCMVCFVGQTIFRRLRGTFAEVV